MLTVVSRGVKKVYYALKTLVTGKYAHHLAFCTLMI